MRWSINPQARFELRHFGDESVLFDSRSGLTHFLNAAAVDVLALLNERALSSQELANLLIERYGGAAGDTFTADVDAILEQLAYLEFIERASE